MAHRIWRLKFFSVNIFSMNHTYDVINPSSKIGTQKQQDLVFSRLDVVHLILSIGKLSLLNYPFCYFLFFHRNLSEDQEINLVIFILNHMVNFLIF